MKNFFKALFVFALIILFPLFAHSQMFWNQTAQFAGNNTSYITVPNSSSLDITGSFSIEAWINPASVSGVSKGIISKGGILGTSLKYALRIFSGRIQFITNGTVRLSSKTTNLITANSWTHIAAAYNSSTNGFSIYINGVQDTTSTIAGAAPTTNPDSLFIGISGSSTPYPGQLDEVRIWNRDLSSAEVASYFRSTLKTSDGIYNGLVLSMPFQKDNSSGIKHTFNDFSGNQNNGSPRNVSAIDQSFKPLNTISMNESIELDGNEDYLAGKDTSTINPSDRLGLECWVNPKTASQTCNLITKGNQYSLKLIGGVLNFSVNGNIVNSGISIPANAWTKITCQYITFSTSFNINGIYATSSNTPFGNVNAGTDSLYVGGVPGAIGDFNGYMDEVRIFNHYLIDDSVFTHTYHSIEKSNDPTSLIDISYNLDGSLADNADNGGPKLYLRNNSRFSHPGGIANQPVSPLNRDVSNAMSDGYYIPSEANKRIPATGTSGLTSFTVPIYLDKPITDVDVFIALNHTKLSNLSIYLKAPNGDSVRLINNYTNSSLDNNLVAIFDDQADSTLGSNKYASLTTTIKPENNMNSVFGGDISKGDWIIKVYDNTAGDTGNVYGCGIRLNNAVVREKNLNMTTFIQGLYNSASSNSLTDTISVTLRSNDGLFTKLDSSRGVFGSNGILRLSFANMINGKQFYVQLNHRNSLETWSAFPTLFKYSNGVYNFHSFATLAYGDNEIQVDNSPLRFGIYSGDVNQDGMIELADILIVFNDAGNFVSGYAVTDLTGDNAVDLNDLLITFNNSSNFVSLIRP